MRKNALLMAALLAFCACQDAPTANVERIGSHDGLGAVGLAVVPTFPDTPFLYWPMDSTGTPSSTGPYGAGMIPLTSLMDHWSQAMQDALANAGSKSPNASKVVYQTGSGNDSKMATVGNIVATSVVRDDAQSPYCGVAQDPVAHLASLGIAYVDCGYSRGGNLSYNNHAGIDVRARYGTPLYAPAQGFISYAQVGPDNTKAQLHHALAICENKPVKPNGPCGSGWKVRLLHLSTWWDGKKLRIRDEYGQVKEWSGGFAPGAPVLPGQLIGYSGDYSVTKQTPGGWGGVADHLHFEVLDEQGIPRDPYGWRASAPDPMGPFSNGPLWVSPIPPMPLRTLVEQSDRTRQYHANELKEWDIVGVSGLRIVLPLGSQGVAKTLEIDFENASPYPNDCSGGCAIQLFESASGDWRTDGVGVGIFQWYGIAQPYSRQILTFSRESVHYPNHTPFDPAKRYVFDFNWSYSFGADMFGADANANLYFRVSGI